MQQLLDRVGHLIKCEGCQQRMGCHRNEDIRHLKTHDGSVQVKRPDYDWLTESRGEEVLALSPQREPVPRASEGEVVYVQEDGSHVRTRTEGGGGNVGG